MKLMRKWEVLGLLIVIAASVVCVWQPEIVKYFGLLSSFLVLLGWLIVFRNAQYTASRTETKSFFDDLMKSISDIESMAVGFWLASRKERQEPKIFSVLMNGKFKVVDAKIDILKRRKLDIGRDDLISLLSRLQESVTLDCEYADTIDATERVLRANTVIADSVKIHTHLYSKFIETYPVKV